MAKRRQRIRPRPPVRAAPPPARPPSWAERLARRLEALPLSTDVRLPAGQAPVFPDLCVACGAERPQAVLQVPVRPGHFAKTAMILGLLRRLIGRGPARVAVPVCVACLPAVRRRQHGLGVAGAAALAVPIAAYVVLRAGGVAEGGARTASFVLALATVGAWAVWSTVAPLAVAITERGGHHFYEFRLRAQAVAFAARNGGVVVDDVEPDAAEEP